MADKEPIMIDGKIIGCPCYIDRPFHRYDKGCLVQSQAFKEQQTEEKPILRCDEIRNCPIKENFKQLARKTQECENLKAEEKFLKQCCQKAGEELAKHSFEYDGKEKNLVVQAMELNEKYEKLSILAQEENARNGRIEYELCDRLKQKTQECEKLKEEILTKNEKIKELRFSVSDLTNRLCYLNAEKSFRIVDLERTLDEIEKELKEDIYCENQECGCDDFEECLNCTKEHILDIINKAKG